MTASIITYFEIVLLSMCFYTTSVGVCTASVRNCTANVEAKCVLSLLGLMGLIRQITKKTCQRALARVGAWAKISDGEVADNVNSIFSRVVSSRVVE